MSIERINEGIEAIAYLLKVMNNGIDVYNRLDSRYSGSTHSKAFKAVRHSNYVRFNELIGEPINEAYAINVGEPIKKITNSSLSGEVYFGQLISVLPSLIKFKDDCFSEFGEIDDDFSDEVFTKLATFELAIKMRANNCGVGKHEDRLEEVIDSLRGNVPLYKKEINKLHEGRKFLNHIKHPETAPDNWKDGLTTFQEAYAILEKHEILII